MRGNEFGLSNQSFVQSTSRPLKLMRELDNRACDEPVAAHYVSICSK